ncbi:uncharacterized protein BKCO1_23000119 [Diplodia corticola]|uniref:Uncharacterized protein n=1 Tax=Diplodia corticola TaxID=236234 RepID=A0A1J9S4B7_9PEZI|nr:uncharacterized protein BKCO1_23000119 [Diplodia corticola]OJD34477.1 hypothetical protein BKCO1_23000119 [Diplodia corticola]
MSKPSDSTSSSDTASVMSSSTTKSTTSLLKKVFNRDSSAKPKTDEQLAAEQRDREQKSTYLTAAATYMSLR